MLRSMTGFGRASFQDNKRSIVIEIKSVNHRFLDLSVKMPRNFISLESKIRNIISSKVMRGKIDVFITQTKYEDTDVKATLNNGLADNYVKCLQEIKKRYNLLDDISVSLISKFPDVINMEHVEDDTEELWNEIKSPLEEALKLLIEMREKEGLKLKEDMLIKITNVSTLVNEIEKIAPSVVTEYKKKLSDRFSELVDNCTIDESRIAAEITIFCDKSCVDEEITRLKSHINQFLQAIELNEPVGRKLDFIVQEMNREVNTIASKSDNLQIVNNTINLKNEIEKIREQIQNIE